jgi:hypothetical protein
LGWFLDLNKLPGSGLEHNVKAANKSFYDVAHFKYLRTEVTDRNSISEEIRKCLNWDNNIAVLCSSEPFVFQSAV